MANVLTFVELRDGEVGKAAREALGVARDMARELGGEAHAAVFGPPGTGDVAPDLGAAGADRIFVAEDAALALYQPDMVSEAVRGLVDGGDYAAVLLPASALGKDLAPRIAAKLERGLATEIVDWAIEDGSVVVRRPMVAGKAIATLRFLSTPALMTLRANVFAPSELSGAGEVERIDVPGIEPRVRVTAVEQGDRDRLDVSEASVIVSGGRGMQGPEHWHLLEELVEALGDEAALGASRAVVDAGWRPHAEQVGQTGKTVSPDLYVAVGISGAIQHLAGMRTAKTIVAINRDPEAPIFSVADYGIVGDAFEILPRLTEEVRKVRQER